MTICVSNENKHVRKSGGVAKNEVRGDLHAKVSVVLKIDTSVSVS